MRPGAYSFDLNTPGAAYEFQYNINSDETNLDVLDKLAWLVNSSSLGITAEILSDGNGSSALKLTSIQTGLADNETELFPLHRMPARVPRKSWISWGLTASLPCTEFRLYTEWHKPLFPDQHVFHQSGI